MSDFEQLIKKKERIEYFSCGHVIPKENLICVGLATGPNKIKFDFSFNNRDNVQMVINKNELFIHFLLIVN